MYCHTLAGKGDVRPASAPTMSLGYTYWVPTLPYSPMCTDSIDFEAIVFLTLSSI